MVVPSTSLHLALRLPSGGDPGRRRHLAVLAQRLGYTSVWVEVAAHDLAAAAELDRLAEVGGLRVGAILDGSPDDVAGWLAEVAALRPDLLVARLPADGIEVLAGPQCVERSGRGVALGVSIGRTMNEAQARAGRDSRFAGVELARTGVFGTFEDAQSQLAALREVGVAWLLADCAGIADEQDVADLLAQLRAAAKPLIAAR
jgi:hypothetical protein